MELRLLVTSAAVSGALGLIPVSQTGLPLPGQEEPIFSAQSELVVLQVMVQDRHGRYVTDLSAEAFSVFEDGTPRTISFFNRLDAPATVGLLVDSSGSMRGVRDLVAAAAGAFVTSSNQEDEMYSIVVRDPLETDANPRRLKRLATGSGGEAFEPRQAGEVPFALQHIARDIRNMYTLGYAPPPNKGFGLRHVRVRVAAPGDGSLRVRTREAYLVEPKRR